MKKIFTFILLVAALLLCGCEAAEQKSLSISSLYAITSLLSVLLFTLYVLLAKKKIRWLTLLFVSVCIINCGYYFLSVSKTLSDALWANRISYFGSVFLPLSILMTIFDVSKIKYKRWHCISLFSLAFVMFLITASPGVLDIYYKSAQLRIVDGVSYLIKDYGVLHNLYAVYLGGYFVAMIGTIIYVSAKKKLSTNTRSVILACAVLANIGVWLIEKFIHFEVEFLSISYIITELFLLGLHILVESEIAATSSKTPNDLQNNVSKSEFEEICDIFVSSLPTLTKTEKKIYEMYVSGLGTKEVLAELSITENTLKYHNKNIYGKLGVSSRKQLLEVARTIKI